MNFFENIIEKLHVCDSSQLKKKHKNFSPHITPFLLFYENVAFILISKPICLPFGI